MINDEICLLFRITFCLVMLLQFFNIVKQLFPYTAVVVDKVSALEIRLFTGLFTFVAVYAALKSVLGIYIYLHPWMLLH